ncbi:MAG: hypothetical protein GXP13_05025 [Gammaproteobacteria bacterium]|nr:hypothetical protein [Gammaproteobacteria bacterium]
MQNKNNIINDCWNKIGVWRSDKNECPKLKDVIHCRNCDIYIESGLSFLNRDLPEDYCSNNTEIYKQEADEDTGEALSVIIFRSQQNWFALKTSLFIEINNDKIIHSIPHNKNTFITGLVNIRGELELCISLDALISNSSTQTDESTNKKKLIIIKLDSGKYALKLDEILGVYRINNNHIQDAASIITGDSNHLVASSFDHKDKHVGLIDHELLNIKLGTLRT